MSSAFSALQRNLVLGVAFSALIPAAVFAQATPPSAPAGSAPAAANAPVQTVGEIVVTGTSLRKVAAPAGAEAFALSPADITATGALSTDQLLADIPQLTSFGALQTASAGGTQLTINRTNIRNLPQGTGGASPTLVLLDGHRIVGAGVNQDYPDPDFIPPALIQRVEVVTDGGSAIYGSDAVGGVINFVTRKDFDGVQAGVRQGFGDDYESTDFNLTVGKAWSGGDAYIGYNYAYHDPLFGRSRNYVREINYTTGLPASQYCSPGNAVVNGSNYAVVGGNSLVLGNANLCDPSKAQEFYPEETRNSVMGGFHQTLTRNLEFDVKGYYSRRDDTSNGGPLTGTATVTAGGPNYIASGGGAAENAYFNFAPVGANALDTTRLWSYGVTPTLTWKIGWDWQMKAYYNYGQSQTTANNVLVNNALLGTDVAAGTINPFNIGASNPAALSQVLNYDNYGIGKESLSNAKVTFDGPIPLVRLPGGAIRLAVGGEYIGEKYQGTTDTDTDQNVLAQPLSRASRTVESGFVELNLPVIGPDNNVPLVNSLTFGAAERFDNYSDFGDNWAPNLGVTLKPVDWISLRARWNKAFQAPSLVQLAQAATPTVGVYPGFVVAAVPLLSNPAVPYTGGSVVNVAGTLSPLQPERAQDWNLGFDVSPPIVKGLSLHVTYWNIQYEGQIGTPPLGYGQFWGVPTYANLYIMHPTDAQISSFLSSAGASASSIANALAQLGSQTAYYVSDTRARNLGVSKVYGIDFAFEYHHPTPFGSVYATFNSSDTLSAKTAADGVDYAANIADINQARFHSATVVGARIGQDFSGQLTWNHLAHFDLSVPAPLNQTSVGAFDTLDIYLQYDLKRTGMPPVALSLGVTNLLDAAPPSYNGIFSSLYPGFAGGSTLGRVFQLGANVKF